MLAAAVRANVAQYLHADGGDGNAAEAKADAPPPDTGSDGIPF